MQIKRKNVILGVFVLFSLAGFLGSLFLSYVGETPCIFCKMLRWTVFLECLIGIAYIIKKVNVLRYILYAGVFFGIANASYLLLRDLGWSSSGGDFLNNQLCSPGSYCSTPLFLNVHVSLWVLSIFLIMMGILVLSEKVKDV